MIVPANFEISQTHDGFYRFQLVGKDGETLLLSAEHESREAVETAIQDVRVGSLMSQLIARGRTPGGGMFFVIKRNSGEVIAKSQLFDNEMLFDNALHKVRDNAAAAEVLPAGA